MIPQHIWELRLTIALHGYLTLKKHRKKALIKLRIMTKLAGTTWGAGIKTHNGNVRPVMEYGSHTFATAAKTNTQRLEKIQNMGLRIITGGIRSKPITAMESMSVVHSLHERRNKRYLYRQDIRNAPNESQNKRAKYQDSSATASHTYQNNFQTKIKISSPKIQKNGKS